jgi:phospholipid/cholesterol/gamma-HCH transport system substrate-binding protein
METRANYVVIGFFTLAVIAAAFAFVYWFQHTGGTGERAVYRVIFSGPVAGLRTGSPVNFNGIRVGEVSDLSLNPSDPKKVDATIGIAPATPVRSDTQVTLEFQGLTGIASLALRGGSPSAPPVPRVGNEPPVLIADSGATQDLTQTAREVLGRLDRLLESNEPVLRSALQNLDTFTQALARNSDRIDSVMAGVETLVGSPEKPGELTLAVRAVRDAAKPVGELAENFNARTAELPELLHSVKQLADNIDQRTVEVPELVASVRKLADNIDQRTVELPELVASLRVFADNIGKASADVPEMVASLKNFANTLDKRATEIANSVTRLSNTGSRQLESLGNEGRRTLADIDRAVRNFDRNPQRLIFGGSSNGVPEYNGRRR